MNIDKKNYVVHLSESYRELKGLFKTFSENWNKKISEYKDYEVSILDSSDTSIKMKVFDKLVEILFCMTFLKGYSEKFIPYGKMIFERFKTEKDKEQITTFYFESNGSIYKEKDRPLANINQENTYESILIEFLYDYLESFKELGKEDTKK